MRAGGPHSIFFSLAFYRPSGAPLLAISEKWVRCGGITSGKGCYQQLFPFAPRNRLITTMNKFSLGAQIGGSEASDSYRAARAQEQQLRNLFNEWSGEYTSDGREFAFLLRIDSNIHKYTELWQIVGAQPAKLKRGYVEVEVGIPEAWWRESTSGTYRNRLAAEVETGFRSIVALMRDKKRQISAERLLSDWAAVKQRFLRTTASETVQ